VWKNLQYDSFPFLWMMIVRGFARAFGAMNDPAFRVFGVLISVAVLGAIWSFVRNFRQPYPLLSLSFFAINPSVVVWTGSVRAYGFGILLGLLTGTLIWKFVQRPGIVWAACAATAATTSVHVLFYNTVIVMAFCAGAIAVCGEKRDWKRATTVLLLGGVATVSLIPYRAELGRISEWKGLVQVPDYNLLWFFTKLRETLNPAGSWAFPVWLGLFAVAVFFGARVIRFHRQYGLTQIEWEAALYAYVALLVGAIGMFGFLKILRYRTAPWYYLSLLALVAVCIDVLLSTRLKTQRARVARLVLIFLVSAATFLSVDHVRTRLTNIDKVASHVETVARPADLVLLSRWVNEVSFSRYYHGAAPWMTVPPIAEVRFHRYDLLKREMMQVDQTVPLRRPTEAAQTALQAGNRVFIVGDLQFPPAGERAPLLPPAPLPGEGWAESPYYRQWLLLLSDFLARHANSIDSIPIRSETNVSEFENVHLYVVAGWRP
jgi:hypothetical protein